MRDQTLIMVLDSHHDVIKEMLWTDLCDELAGNGKGRAIYGFLDKWKRYPSVKYGDMYYEISELDTENVCDGHMLGNFPYDASKAVTFTRGCRQTKPD